MVSFKTILVPTEFDAFSTPTILYAAELAEKFNAKLVLLHVVPDVALALPDAVMPTPVLPPALNELLDAAKTGLANVQREENLSRFPTQLEVRVGSPAAEIVEVAKSVGADLICIGTHGRGGLSHFLLGSVAEKVIRHAPCPVLTIRPKAAPH